MAAVFFTTLLLSVIATCGYGMMKTQKANAGRFYGTYYGAYTGVGESQLNQMEQRGEFRKIGTMASVGEVENRFRDLMASLLRLSSVVSGRSSAMNGACCGELLPEADVVFSALPDTKATRKIFCKKRFQKMKRSAILLNAGRGSAVDTEDLCQALISGEIYAAGLDVTDPEPLPSQHKLWNMQNAVITPHISGDFHHPATLYRIVDIAAGNLKRYGVGEPLENVVDVQTGYRK